MRIVQICYLYEPAIGGVELVVKKVSEGLVRLGHEVHVVTSDFTSLACEARIAVKEEIINGVHVHRVSGWKMPRKHLFAARMVFPGLALKLWRLGKFSIIHVHSIPSNHFDLAWLHARLHRIPLVAQGHYSPDDLDTVFASRSFGARYFKWWTKSLLRRADKYIAVVGAEGEKIHELCGLKKRTIHVIPNGVSPEEFDAVCEADVLDFRARHGLMDERLIIFVGRVTKHKGPDLLIDSMNLLFASGKLNDCKVLIIGPQGDRAYAASLKSNAREKGYGECFRFLELNRRDVVAAMKAGQILVLPSRGEVFGIVLAEAMYCGKVVIGTNAGGIPEVLDHGGAGLLFEKDDVEGLAGQIFLAMDEAVCESLQGIAVAGRNKAVQHFNWTVITSQVESMYRELL